MLSLLVTTTNLAGRRISLDGGTTTIGRQEQCAGHLDDPTVSRRHAVIEQDPYGMVLRDLGSSNGTSVNGVRVFDAVRLQPGDRVAFGDVETVVERPSNSGGLHVGSQGAGQINNVEGNQFIQHVRAERESFLADIAGTKTKARRLVTLGFLALFLGFAMFAYGIVSFILGVQEVTIDTPQSAVPPLFGPDLGGVPLGVYGFGLALVGSFTLIAGIVLHVSAAARLRRLPQPGFPAPLA
jgi:hypothetical protein